jgi:hypothetical protein
MKSGTIAAVILATGASWIPADAQAADWTATDASRLLENPRLSRESRDAIRARIDAVHARFRRTHGGGGPEQFGVQCCQITQIPAAAFTPMLQGASWNLNNYGYMYPVSGSSNLWAPVSLPSGVEIQYFGFYYYDNDLASDVQAEVDAYTGGGPGSGAPSSNALLLLDSATGPAGYGYLLGDLVYPVNNLVAYDPEAAQLAVLVYVGAATANLQFKAVELWWMRQVSPGPATATFNDVPTNHPFFQYVEALAASGITAGCQAAPPLYCPDQPLTRGQMAVFLSKALGLYWPN